MFGKHRIAISQVVPFPCLAFALCHSNEAALQKAMAIIAERINKAKSIIAFTFHNFAARLTEAGAEGNRSAGLSFRYNAHGKMRHRRGSSAVCWHVCRRGIRAENAPNRRRRGSRPRSRRRQFERHHYGGLFGQLDLSRFITVGLDDIRIGDEIIANVRLADVLSALCMEGIDLVQNATPNVVGVNQYTMGEIHD